MRGFTLIEITLVIVIISILMMIVFRFGGDRLQLLQMQTTKETIIGFREGVISNNRTSSYIAEQNYQTMDVTFTTDNSQITAIYNSVTGAIILTDYSTSFANVFWKIMSPSGTQSEVMTLRYSPYILGCEIWLDTKKYEEAMLMLQSIGNPQVYCFAISAQTCMVKEVNCPDTFS